MSTRPFAIAALFLVIAAASVEGVLVFSGPQVIARVRIDRPPGHDLRGRFFDDGIAKADADE